MNFLKLMTAGVSLWILMPADVATTEQKFTGLPIQLKEVQGTSLMELVSEDLVFVDSAGRVWTAPNGTHTDGATVPRLALSISDGRFDRKVIKAALIHDAYCQSFNRERCPEQYQQQPWQAVHRMFYEACLAGGYSGNTAKVLYAAVWLGGPRWDAPESGWHALPQAEAEKVYVVCRTWIEREDPSLEEIETWMHDLEKSGFQVSSSS